MTRIPEILGAAFFAILFSFPVLGEQEGYVAPRFQSGATPQLPPLASAGGFVVIEAKIAASGIVTDTIVVDDSPPFTAAVETEIRVSRFQPATLDGAPLASRASVIGVFRAPVLMGGTSPEPKHASIPSEDVPYPIDIATPSFPPQALYDGVVMLEVRVNEEGTVTSVSDLSPPGGFDQVSLEAVHKFRFRPAKMAGRPVTAYAVVIFGFAQPRTPRIPR